ncbi:MAG: Gfo/Idh/MocA family oxidoreductase [Oscillospiraceae bacterium]|nr:Gfo/Idh/MocA family oxidoreductase [Oscillospiraceae bacterium]
MLRAGLIGLGGMGRGHLGNLIRFTAENEIIKLTSICDIDPEKFKNVDLNFNIKGMGTGSYDFDQFNCYTDMDEMIAKEELDIVVIALPTYLHCPATVKCLKKGINVLCEKPMALNAEECQLMIDTANQMGKRLMVGQCLRFWGEYMELKKLVSGKMLGKPISGYFYRGGSPPLWSYQNWILKRECGGGALHDQHVHDVDTINYIFGMPDRVTSLGRVVFAGGYDAVSTNYIYNDDLVINAQDDWSMMGRGFSMVYRVSFEYGSATFDHEGLKILNKDGNDITPSEYDKENAYYSELKYLAECIINNAPNTINPPEDSCNTIKIIEAETKSADNKGEITKVI